MTLDMLAILMIAGFFFLNLRVSSVFQHTDSKIDRLDSKMDRMALELRERDDKNFLFLSEKIDTIYKEVFRKSA